MSDRAPNITADPRWRLLCARATVDPAADDLADFVYAVSTTGVYCRSGCPSRRPKPENVHFFAAAADAERAGFRPCKRCRPQRAEPPPDPRQALVAAACRMIENAERPPALERLAERIGLSPFHFHRLFKKTTGITPKAYAQACRQRRLQQELQTDAKVSDALYQAGFGASSRLYEQSDALLGMSPGRYKNGAAGVVIRYALAECFLGGLAVAVSERGVCAVELGGERDELVERLGGRFPRAELHSDPRGLGSLVAELVAAIDTPGRACALPLDIQGTVFQRRVWQALRSIPSGTTVSYAELAAAIGRPRATRAVARACAANRLAVLIPCHRVVRSDGDPGGYRWGEASKKRLLAREAEVRSGD